MNCYCLRLKFVVLACFISARALSMTFQFPCRRIGVYGQLHDMGIYLGTKLVTRLVGKLIYIILESVPGVRFLGVRSAGSFLFFKIFNRGSIVVGSRIISSLLCPFGPSFNQSVSESVRQAGRKTDRQSEKATLRHRDFDW